ncbi:MULTISPECIES: hypothetical protein [unclassified Bradyrhizobium]|uniref:hypothetical protein n=1 Tax=unclassified Bradyrhizobium TaxID=2631580 RepID=UPI0029164044|nr:MULTISPECIES: hypothetical protein [unclassified Bradyrhizobium]
MSRLPTSRSAEAGNGAMKSWRTIALHTATAAVFMFALQRFVLNASLETSLLWVVVFGGCAAGLAYTQSNR